MITVRFYVGTEEREGTLSTFCPHCSCEFEPLEAQAAIGAPIEVHCPACGALALRWAPPPPPLPAEADVGG